MDWPALSDVMNRDADCAGTLENAVGPALQGDFGDSQFTKSNAATDPDYGVPLIEFAGPGRRDFRRTQRAFRRACRERPRERVVGPHTGPVPGLGRNRLARVRRTDQRRRIRKFALADSAFRICSFRPRGSRRLTTYLRVGNRRGSRVVEQRASGLVSKTPLTKAASAFETQAGPQILRRIPGAVDAAQGPAAAPLGVTRVHDVSATAAGDARGREAQGWLTPRTAPGEPRSASSPVPLPGRPGADLTHCGNRFDAVLGADYNLAV